MKNITRYTLEKTSFLGWRLCISRKGIMVTKYLPDKVYGGEQPALEAAIAMRDEILERIAEDPTNAKKLMQEMKARLCPKRRRKKKS